MEFKRPDYDLTAFIDREAMIKIGSNLISNAIKYADTTTSVSLVYQPGDHFFKIQFCNDGKGIAEEYKQKIFEPFYRIKGSNKPGTGIGLSLAQSLTELHNGKLRLLSGRPGNIIFELELPIHQEFEFHLSTWKNIK